jgi:ABC-type glycerol-3-phosphate transport system substrate-binding protein
LREIVASFNQAYAEKGWRAEITSFPDFQLTERTAIAAAARDLPDAFEIDGPLVARCVDADLLAPLDDLFTPEELGDFIPTILAQGRVKGRLYALGAFDSAMALYFDRSLLARAGVTPPPDGQTWTWDELLSACQRLQAAGIEPLTMHMNESADEWFTYAFSPVIWSGGGKLISDDGTTVRGVLASAENIHSLQAWQRVFKEKYAATDPIDPNPFDRGAVALDWTGHWLARSHEEKIGAQLGVMSLPRVGAKAVAPCGSFCWGISSHARNRELAVAWVRWITSREHGVVPIVRANGSVPARRSAFAEFPEYQHLPYRLFKDQLDSLARPRPRTPYYATLTQHFAAALRDISRGADVATRLRSAEEEIQKVIDRRVGSAAPVKTAEVGR